ncbi:hypothetical protein HZH68_007796 [Vespula germanica]|uniref:Uncharacterized protein n=1 Tax=Vespula germanica TaxID=30212 RepID=A0A834K2K4_VESGE|nr:hypothetical protein HZH68_007796 [Vespula germanica]
MDIEGLSSLEEWTLKDCHHSKNVDMEGLSSLEEWTWKDCHHSKNGHGKTVITRRMDMERLSSLEEWTWKDCHHSKNGRYMEVAGFHVPPLHTSCDPSTKLGLRENYAIWLIFGILTGEYNLPRGGRILCATFSFYMLSLYKARFTRRLCDLADI